jgi:glycosyltransferase involved in cell wall biosynthesis
MLISILITAYNVEHFIERCLLSCNFAFNERFEIIIVNDGSADATLDIINNFILENRIENIKVISTINKGLPLARQEAIARSSGDYFIFIDGDDDFGVEAGKYLREFTPGIYDIVFFEYDQLIKNRTVRVGNFFENERSARDVIISMMLGTTSWSFCFKLIKRVFYDSVNVVTPEISLGEDGYVIMQLLINSPSCFFKNVAISRYHIRTTSMTNSIDKNYVNLYVQSFYNIRSFIPLELVGRYGLLFKIRSFSRVVDFPAAKSILKPCYFWFIYIMNLLTLKRFSNIYSRLLYFYCLYIFRR